MSLKKLFLIIFGIQFALFIGLGIMTFRLFRHDAEHSRSRDVHFRSWLLADELRQSSDDLTRMAQTYVATGNDEYERQYWAVLDIRNGKSPRPVKYNQIYWDLVTSQGRKPREDGETISLHDLMIREGFTSAEFDKLTEAQKNSDKLVNVERIAMNAVKGLFDDGTGNFTVKKKPDRELAIRLMNDEAYHKTKASIMKPIDEFYVMFEKRTANDVVINERHARNSLLGIIVLVILGMGIFVFSFVMILYQIRRHEQSEDALQESEKNLREAQHLAHIGSWKWTMATDIVKWSEELYHINGRDPNSPAPSYTEMSSCYIPESWKRLSEAVAKAIQSGESYELDLEIVRPDGSTRYTSAWGEAIYDANGKIAGLQGTVQDITDRKLAEEEIKNKNKELLLLNAEKDKFFSIIAHDLRNPFNSLLGFTQLLVEELPTMTQEQVQKMAVSMRRSATNLFSLLENLLDWSRLQRGITTFDPESFFVMPKISGSLALSFEAIKSKKININCDIPEEIRVFADGNMFESIIRNLISNAIKFTPPNGKITITAMPKENNWVEISIKDTGIGMNQEMVGNLFRVEINTSRKGTAGEHSTGLGLIICKDFIEKHGGKIWVESEEGKGTTFYFTLPNKNDEN